MDLKSGNPTELTINQLFLSDSCQAMIQCAGFSSEDLLLLYSEFIQHCFPSQLMNMYSFCKYLNRSMLIICEPDDVSYLFRAFSCNMQEFISVTDFVLGLTALDKRTPHGGKSGRIRAEFIYRYYHSYSDKYQRYQFDMERFARDLLHLKTKKPPIDEEMRQTVAHLYSTFDVPLHSQVPLDKFKKVLGTRNIRGTAAMFRSVQSPIGHIKANPLYDPEMRDADMYCGACRSKPYNISLHSVKMASDGTIVDPIPNCEPLQRNRPLANTTQSPKAVRKQSEQMFSKNLFNTLIDEIRAINKMIYSYSELYNFWDQKQNKIYRKLILLCDKVQPVLEKEPRVLKVKSPVYVIGDIHGRRIKEAVIATNLSVPYRKSSRPISVGESPLAQWAQLSHLELPLSGRLCGSWRLLSGVHRLSLLFEDARTRPILSVEGQS